MDMFLSWQTIDFVILSVFLFAMMLLFIFCSKTEGRTVALMIIMAIFGVCIILSVLLSEHSFVQILIKDILK